VAETFTVRVQKEQFTFCAAHFITYEGEQCERLHGHNYRVGVELAGRLGENAYVFDFIALKHLVRELTEQLDHRMLIPLHHPRFRLEVGEREVVLHYGNKQWCFPRDDCALLPVSNTTAEMLAKYLAERIMASLQRRGFKPDWLRVEVEEAPGQTASYTWTNDRT
jgi:6-pyruvoyltetrahydropterin/6-carboxytetrahydropterin synthase